MSSFGLGCGEKRLPRVWVRFDAEFDWGSTINCGRGWTAGARGWATTGRRMARWEGEVQSRSCWSVDSVGFRLLSGWARGERVESSPQSPVQHHILKDCFVCQDKLALGSTGGTGVGLRPEK